MSILKATETIGSILSPHLTDWAYNVHSTSFELYSLASKGNLSSSANEQTHYLIRGLGDLIGRVTFHRPVH